MQRLLAAGLLLGMLTQAAFNLGLLQSESGELDLNTGLVGDTWNRRRSTRTEDGSPHPEMQLNVINSRVIDMIAGGKTRWGLAGDQLYVDLDISAANVPRAVAHLLAIAPEAQVVDISHEVDKYNIRHGALLLWCALPFLPIGAHVAVVDPGALARLAPGRHSDLLADLVPRLLCLTHAALHPPASCRV